MKVRNPEGVLLQVSDEKGERLLRNRGWVRVDVPAPAPVQEVAPAPKPRRRRAVTMNPTEES